MSGTPDILAAIVASTRRAVEVRAQQHDQQALRRVMESCRRKPGALGAALAQRGRFNVIAECKRRSPSRGVLRKDYDAPAIARSYEASGAAAVSVLTEPSFFDGSLEDLAAVRRAVALPILRKDFIVDEYQLIEARAAGADAALLVVAALEDDRLRALIAQARACGLDVLVEVHDGEELTRALDAGADIIGVNSRNLRTLDVDLKAFDLVERMPSSVHAVAESGLKTRSDLDRLHAQGFRGFLIGEQLMIQPDPGAGLRELLRPET
jgi:indole-3-glycerol phosphate synthase